MCRVVSVVRNSMPCLLQYERRGGFKCHHPHPHMQTQMRSVAGDSVLLCAIVPQYVWLSQNHIVHREDILSTCQPYTSIIPPKTNRTGSTCQFSLSSKQKPHWRPAMWSCHPLPLSQFSAGATALNSPFVAHLSPRGVTRGSLCSMDSLSAIVSQYQFMVSRI